MKRLAVLFVAAFLIGCPTGDPEPDPTPAPLEPGVFQSGAARVRMPMPLGIGTAGSNPIGGEASSDSPYAKNFPATTRLHGHPDIRAIAYSRGEGFEVILVRSDMIAMLAQLRDEVVAELLVRTGRDYDDALVFGATHTHSGPGRFVQGFYSVITDSFFPAFYEALVASAADVIEQALADLAPAEMAVVQATAPEAHDDRRCEDGLDYTNDTTPLIVTRKDGVVESVAVHRLARGGDDGEHLGRGHVPRNARCGSARGRLGAPRRLRQDGAPGGLHVGDRGPRHRHGAVHHRARHSCRHLPLHPGAL